jgi:TonB family protein
MQGIVDQPEFSRTEISENPRPGESLTTSPAEPTAAPGPDGATGQSEEPEPTPTEPPFSPIEVPVPQDPGRLDIPESNPEGLGETEVEESPVPTRLIARISHQPIAQQDSNDVGMGDQPARPIQDRETFVSDPTVSACTVNPAVMTSLGTAVGLRVATDASGAVIEAIVQQSSQNPAYDELAACLVNNWQFEPAMYQGQPVDNDQLLVYITIEPEE